MFINSSIHGKQELAKTRTKNQQKGIKGPA